jgi:hypothetical protein
MLELSSGISMPFRAVVDGENLLSLRIDKEAWRSLTARVRAGEDLVRMTCCQSPGILKISSRGRQFFAHRSQPVECEWKPESPAHIELKAVVHEAVLGVGGWAAEVEASGTNWQADVLATRGKVRIAIEVQLSTQGQAKTWFREDRYETAAVLPWWIVSSRRNAGSGFGSGLRSIVEGDDLTAMLHSTREAIRDLLRRVESQVRIAEVIAIYFRERNVRYQLKKFCLIPVAFIIKTGSADSTEDQVLVVGELGADILPDFEDLCNSSQKNPWGAVVQFVSHVAQIKGFGLTAFFVKKDPSREIPPILDRLLSGKLVWRGPRHRDEVEAAFVWYRETCRGCGKPFARAPFAICGHLSEWPNYPLRLVAFSPEDEEEEAKTQEIVRQFETREQLTIGERWHPQANDPSSPALQNCPHCGYTHDDSLISADLALRLWPYAVADWFFRMRINRGGWMKADPLPIRRRPPTHAWTETVEIARHERDKIEQERSRQKQEQERRMAETHEQLRLRREAEAAAVEAARVEAARRWKEEEDQRREIERRVHEDKCRMKLRALALVRFGREDQADLWMKARHPRLGACPFDACIGNFEQCVSLLPSRRKR